MSKINRGSGVLVVLRGLWRRGSVLEGRVQVRGGVRRPHALPYFRSGARGTAASCGGFILLLPCGAFRDYTARHPGPSAVSRVRSSSGPRVRQLEPSAASIPSTLPSWTHEDTSVHARGRDRSPEERRTRHITAAVMRLHSLQVCASSHAARPGCFSAPPLSHTHSRREPGEGRRIRDGEMLIIRGGGNRLVTVRYLINIITNTFKGWNVKFIIL